MAKVSAKDKTLNGWVLGVWFKDGEAVTESPVSIAFFRKNPKRFDVSEETPKNKVVDSGKEADKPAGK